MCTVTLSVAINNGGLWQEKDIMYCMHVFVFMKGTQGQVCLCVQVPETDGPY